MSGALEKLSEDRAAVKAAALAKLAELRRGKEPAPAIALQEKGEALQVEPVAATEGLTRESPAPSAAGAGEVQQGGPSQPEVSDVDYAERYWKRDPHAREPLMVSIRSAGDYGSLSFMVDRSGVNERDKELLAASKLLAQEMGYDLGSFEFNKDSGVVTASIKKAEAGEKRPQGPVIEAEPVRPETEREAPPTPGSTPVIPASPKEGMVGEKSAEKGPEEILEQTRTRYIEEYQKYLREKKPGVAQRINKVLASLHLAEKEEPELSEELIRFKVEYDEAKITYGKKLHSEGLESARIFQKLVVDEKRLLQHKEIETWPPKDRSRMSRALGWWMQQKSWKRLLISSAVMTGAFAAAPLVVPAAAGFASASSAITFGALRLVRGSIGAISAQGVGKGVDWIVSRAIKKGEEESIEHIKRGFSLEEFREFEEDYQYHLNEIARLNKIKNYTKWVAMWVTGYGAANIAEMGLGWLGEAYTGGGRPQTSRVAPPPEVEPGAPVAPPASGVSAAPSIPEAPAEAPEIVPARPATPAVLEAPKAPPAPETPPAPQIDEKLLELATVKKGEGVWHSVYRQLDERLRENPAQFGLKPEDLENPAKIKEILNRETGKLLIDQGYIRPDGTEIRIAKPGVKVLLGADNEIKIEGEGVTYEWQRPKIESVEPQHEGAEPPPEGTEAPGEGISPEADAEITPSRPSGEVPVEPGGAEAPPETDTGVDVTKAEEPPVVIEDLGPVLDSDKEEIFNKTIFSKGISIKELRGAVIDLAQQIKSGKVTVEDFASYLAIKAERIPPGPESLEVRNLKAIFNGILNEKISKEGKEFLINKLTPILKELRRNEPSI